MLVFFCLLVAFLFAQLNIVVTRTSLCLVETPRDVALQRDVARAGYTALHITAVIKCHLDVARTNQLDSCALHVLLIDLDVARTDQLQT